MESEGRFWGGYTCCSPGGVRGGDVEDCGDVGGGGGEV